MLPCVLLSRSFAPRTGSVLVVAVSVTVIDLVARARAFQKRACQIKTGPLLIRRPSCNLLAGKMFCHNDL